MEMLCGEGLSDVMDVMGHCVILRAEFNWASNVMTYEAWCPLFDHLDEGHILPKYIFETNTGGGPLVARRC
jgi:hypothetical protein